MNNRITPILFAEDNVLDIELTLEAFTHINIKNKIEIVRDGQEVLDYLLYQNEFKNRPIELPALIILDYNMPKLSGVEALKRIKSYRHLSNIPIIMMISSKLEEHLFKSNKLKIDAFLIKPIYLEPFMTAIQKIGMDWAIFNSRETY